jgi:hypothetical protein
LGISEPLWLELLPLMVAVRPWPGLAHPLCQLVEGTVQGGFDRLRVLEVIRGLRARGV